MNAPIVDVHGKPTGTFLRSSDPPPSPNPKLRSRRAWCHPPLPAATPTPYPIPMNTHTPPTAPHLIAPPLQQPTTMVAVGTGDVAATTCAS